MSPTSSSRPGSRSRTAPTCTHLAAAETTVALDYDELPSLERAREILAHWERLREERAAGDALEWEIRSAQKYEYWARELVAAVEEGHPTHQLRIQAIRVNDVV